MATEGSMMREQNQFYFGLVMHTWSSMIFCRKWSKVESLGTITDPVHDIYFAPNIGRSYHVLAIASKELHIVSLKPLR